MSDGQRIFAILMGCLGAFFLIAGGIGVYWWKHQGSAWLAQGKVAFEEGRELGPTGDNHMCLDRSLERFGACDQSVGCEISVLVFLNACLAEAEPSEDFCHEVPAQTELFDSIGWRRERCDAAGYSGDLCDQVFASVQGYCDGLRIRGMDAEADPPDKTR